MHMERVICVLSGLGQHRRENATELKILLKILSYTSKVLLHSFMCRAFCGDSEDVAVLEQHRLTGRKRETFRWGSLYDNHQISRAE